MSVKGHIPNVLTLANVGCGFMALVALLHHHEVKLAALLMAISLVLDFLDGMLARLLGVSGELGKQLDSLADGITFGALPGAFVYHMLEDTPYWWAAILVPMFSVLRLGKFNLDTRQSDGFIGLNTPANAIFWAGLVLSFDELLGGIVTQRLELSIASLALVTSLLLVSEIPMFSFKVKNLGWKGNEVRYLFLICAAALIIFSVIRLEMYFVPVPIIILLYLIFSIINNLLAKRHEIQS